MKYIKLGELCDLQNGFAFKSSDYVKNSNTLNCRMSNIRPGAIFDLFYNPKYLPDNFSKKYSEFLLNDGDIVIAMTDLAGDPKILGVPAQVKTEGKKVLLNQRVGKLIIKDPNLDFRYLKYVLSNPRNKDYYKKFSGGGLQINISKKDILNLEIPLHESNEQIIIADKLDIIQALIDNKNKQINMLNQLIKSQFVEMFVKQFWNNEVTIEDVCETMKIGPFGSALHKNEISTSGDVFVLGTDNAVDNEFKIYEKRFITIQKYNELSKYEVKPGDIIISMMGTIGRTSIIPNDLGPAIISSHLCYLTPNKTLISSEFLHYTLKYNDSIFYQIDKQKKGAIMSGLNLKIIKSLKFDLPPIELQNKFAQIVEQINKQKYEFEKSLKKIEELQAALMQEYFG